MTDTTRLTLDFEDVAVLRDMARHYLDTTSTFIADDEDPSPEIRAELRRELTHERGIAADLYERADAAVKRLVARG